MGGIYGGKDIRPISQKQDSLHGLINTILDKLPLGVFVKDAEDGFRYLYWNRFMEEITGIGTEEVEGHNDFELSFDAMFGRDIGNENRVACEIPGNGSLPLA